MAIDPITDESVGTLRLGELEVRRLGFGAMRITGKGVWGPPGDHEECLAVLRRSLELGVNLIDTADSYGPEVSEELIAEALHPYPEGLVIATKGGFKRPARAAGSRGRPEHLRAACEGSLRRLRVERIDLYQLHVPTRSPLRGVGRGAQGAAGRGQDPPGRRLQRQLEQLATARGIVDVVSVQNRYNLGDRDREEVLAACEADGIGFIPWFPLDAGTLGRAGRRRSPRSPRRHDATPPRSRSPGCWRSSPVMLPIPGTSSVAHLEENLAAAAIELSDDEVAELDTAA